MKRRGSRSITSAAAVPEWAFSPISRARMACRRGGTFRTRRSRRLRRSPLRQLPVGPDEMAGVAVRDTLEVILMLRLRFPERPGGRHFGDDLAGPEPGGVHVIDGVFS